MTVVEGTTRMGASCAPRGGYIFTGDSPGIWATRQRLAISIEANRIDKPRYVDFGCFLGGGPLCFHPNQIPQCQSLLACIGIAFIAIAAALLILRP